MDVVRSQEMEVESYYENGFLVGLHGTESSGGGNIFSRNFCEIPRQGKALKLKISMKIKWLV